MPVTSLPACPDAAGRVLHTSDWHLGVAVRNEPRDVDHDAVIAEIIAIARAAEPDLIVHTGDLFNTGRPAMADFARALRALRALAEIAPVVVLSGNHDSAIAFDTLGLAAFDEVPDQASNGTYRPLEFSPSRIRVMSRPVNAAHGAVATYPTRTGGRLRFVGLPFVHANRVAGDWEDVLSAHSLYADGIRKICDLLTTAAFGDFDPTTDVAVFASHLHVTGARTSSEKEIHISSEYATDPAVLNNRYGYLAFGHIHVPQAVAAGRGRYAGSPLEVDFGEEGEAKQLVIADLTPGRPTAIHDVALTAARTLHRLRAPLSELATHADRLGPNLVEVYVTAEPAAEADSDGGPAGSLFGGPDLTGFDSLAAAVRAALPDVCLLGVVDASRPGINVADEIELPETTESVPEQFRDWLATSSAPLFTRHAVTGAADPERVASLFEEVFGAVGLGADPEPPEYTRLLTLTGEDA
jgi:exonuclease SbcD